MANAYSFDVVAHDTVALSDENGFDVAHLVRQPRLDGTPGFRTTDDEWQEIVDALFSATDGGVLTTTDD